MVSREGVESARVRPIVARADRERASRRGAGGAAARRTVAFGVVVNPHAGGNRHERRRAEDLRRLVGDLGIVCETQDFADIDQAARRFRAAGIEVLAVCGGDGSFFRTLSAVVRAYDGAVLPGFLPLRAGSMNTIARAVGCRRGRPQAVLAAALEDWRAGRPFEVVEHDLLCVAGRRYGFMFGAGLIVNFLQAYYARRQRGPRAAASLLGRLCAGSLLRSAEVQRLFKVTPAAISCDGRDLGKAAWRVIFASTVREIGLGFQLGYRAGEQAGTLHFLAGSPSPLQALLRLPAVRLGRPLNLPGWHDLLARRVTVGFERPAPYMIDGDILEETATLELSVGPRLSVIRKQA